MFLFVYTETTKYLKIEPQEIEFHTIYKEISEYALKTNIITDKVPIEDILENEGIALSDLKMKYKLTPALIEKVKIDLNSWQQ